eukprot:3307854-Rhodomonas_salina.1
MSERVCDSVSVNERVGVGERGWVGGAIMQRDAGRRVRCEPNITLSKAKRAYVSDKRVVARITEALSRSASGLLLLLCRPHCLTSPPLANDKERGRGGGGGAGNEGERQRGREEEGKRGRGG